MLITMTWQYMVMWFPSVFPVRLVWLGTAFMIIGGGNSAMVAAIWTVIADVTTLKDR